MIHLVCGQATTFLNFKAALGKCATLLRPLARNGALAGYHKLHGVAVSTLRGVERAGQRKEFSLKEKDIGELHKKWDRQTNIVAILIAIAIGLSIALALGLLAVLGPK